MRTTTVITAEELARVVPVLGPCELVSGELLQMSPGGFRHSEVTAAIVGLLVHHNRGMRTGRVLTNETGLVVARHPDTVRGADVAFISFERLPAHESPSGFLTVPPELVVEVFGDDAPWADIEKKIAEYHAFGVDAVWVVDPRMLAVRVYGRDAQPITLHGEDELTAAHPAGFRCRVAELFA